MLIISLLPLCNPGFQTLVLKKCGIQNWTSCHHCLLLYSPQWAVSLSSLRFHTSRAKAVEQKMVLSNLVLLSRNQQGTSYKHCTFDGSVSGRALACETGGHWFEFRSSLAFFVQLQILYNSSRFILTSYSISTGLISLVF